MRTRAILSVLGEDRVGIVAAVSAVLADHGVNIEDMRQSVVTGIFSLTMLVSIDEDRSPFDRVEAALTEAAGQLGLQASLQREDVFRTAHRA